MINSIPRKQGYISYGVYLYIIKIQIHSSCEIEYFVATHLCKLRVMKIHSSCEIEDFVEIYLCKLCVILRSRVLRVVCPHKGYRSATPLATTAVCARKL